MLVPLLRLLTVGAISAAVADAAPSVTLPNGAIVTGSTETNAAGNPVNVFRGIPYAEPPVGERRWTPSTLKTLTSDVNATSYGNACHAIADYPVSVQYPESEDCLFLNVFAPSGATRDSKLPVMLWIHGGAFITGNPYTMEGGTILAAANEKIVYVSINYRLGVFGFFSNKAILEEGGGANFGLQDQEVAFRWVKTYIEHFGGDPDDITAFGESAGSMSIAMHMLARNGDQKLFKRAIMQSGTYTTTHDTATPSVQENQTQIIAKGVGCADDKDVLACLRRANASEVHQIGGSLNWIPTVDGVYMKEMPIQRLLAGKVSRVPTIIGTNRDEGWLFTFEAADASKYDSFVRTRFSMLTEAEYAQVSDLYPSSGFLTAHHRVAEIFGDIIFVCPSEQFSQTLAENPETYRYYFNYTSNEFGYPLVIHGADIDYVFNHTESIPEDEGAKRVVDHFQTYWVNFATTGSPNSNNPLQSTQMVWPQFDAAKQQLVIQPELTLETNGVNIAGHIERCAFWLDVEKRITSEIAFA